MNYPHYGSGNTVELADSDSTETFGTLVGYTDREEIVNMLQSLGVPNDKLRGLVCAHALSEAGLD